ncbi:MAG: class I SAM-dependent methyltransferase [Melioribacteraceae bacterium]|nr:class I SAM-dependent methyltransferase [Melioribacteraceae bacterium]
MSQEWFKDWFESEDYLTVYKHRNNNEARQLLDLIIEKTGIESGAKILDSACGAGRHSIHLAKLGFDVVAFDLSETLLRIAKKNSFEQNLKIQFYQRDIREAFFDVKFDLILNLFTSFGYFEEDSENFQFILNAHNMLKPRGFFVFDYFNKNLLINNLVPESITHLADKIITERRRFDGERVIKDIEIKQNGSTNIFYESVRLYSPEEILTHFSKIGFKAKSIFGDYSGTRFDETTSKRLVIFFTK